MQDLLQRSLIARPGRLEYGASSKCLAAAALLLASSLVFLPLDLPVARWCAADRLPGDLHKLIMLAEVFAHGSGVFLILLAVWVLDPLNRPKLPRVVCCAFGAGILANLGKLLVARWRPHSFSLDQSVWATFHDFAPLLSGEELQTAVQSFPSAHTATGVGLAIGLGWLYPHGRGLFLSFAILAGLQRIVALDHYVSDTLAGGAAGCLGSACLFVRRGPALLLDRLEAPRAQQDQTISRAA